MNKRLRLILVFLISASSVARAAEEPGPAIVLDLESALRLAVSENLALRAGALSPAVANEQLRQARGQFDPELGMSYYRSQESNSQPLDPFGTRPPNAEVRSDDYQVGLSGQLPWGATYQTGLSSQNQRGSYNSFTDTYYTFLGVSITQPLLRNFGPQAAMAPVRLARAESEAAKWRYQGLVNDTLTGTAFAFFRLALARGSLGVAERSVALGEQLVRDNEKRQERGAMSTQDVLEARARAARRRESLFIGREAVSATENGLKRYLYADAMAVANRPIEPRLPASTPPTAEDLTRWAGMAFATRPDYQEARLGVDQRRIALGLEKSRFLPQVNLVARYGYNGTGPAFSDSLDRVREADSDSYSVGAVVSVPLPNRAASGRKRAAELELRRAELILADFEQEVRRQLADALAAITAGTQRVEATREARTLAERSLEAEEKRLRAGTSSTFLVLEQQENLSQAQLRELQAAADLGIALAEFHRLAGRTVAAFGLDPEVLVPPPAR
jgi:outer membrane protein